MKRILHIDMDAFFASVEQVKNPDLKGKPVIVGGKKGDRRGVVSTASYEAREFGVHSAMPIGQAVKRCPHGVFLRGTPGLYGKVSAQIRGILGEVSPHVEMTSIDEGYIDITGSIRLFGNEDAIAEHLKARILADTGLSCTIGISSNRMISKVASALDKPNGYVWVAPGEEQHFLAPLDVGRIPGIGPKLTERLNRDGIVTVSDLSSMGLEELVHRYENTGASLHRIGQGRGNDSITPIREAKSMGRETTFSDDESDWAVVEATLRTLLERTLHGMRTKGMDGRCVTLKMRSPDFMTHTYSRTMDVPTALEPEIWAVLQELIAQARKHCDSVRLVGVQLSGLTTSHHQLMLEETESTLHWEDAMNSVDAIRERFGFGVVQSGKAITSKETWRKGPRAPE